MMYDGYIPPIQAYYAAKEKELEGTVIRTVESVNIHVDREELLKALKYDRGQYKAGYDAGFSDGFVETLHIVRCRDCKFWEPYGSKGTRNGEDPLEWEGGCMKWRGRHVESDFCSCGERRTENGK